MGLHGKAAAVTQAHQTPMLPSNPGQRHVAGAACGAPARAAPAALKPRLQPHGGQHRWLAQLDDCPRVAQPEKVSVPLLCDLGPAMPACCSEAPPLHATAAQQMACALLGVDMCAHVACASKALRTISNHLSGELPPSFGLLTNLQQTQRTIASGSRKPITVELQALTLMRET